MIYYTRKPRQVKLGKKDDKSKVSATIAQVRGKYVLLRTDAKEYPGVSIFHDLGCTMKVSSREPLVNTEAEWLREDILPYKTILQYVVKQVEAEFQQQAEPEYQLGGTTTSTSDGVEIPMERELVALDVATVIGTRFNIVYDMLGGTLYSTACMVTAFRGWTDELRDPSKPKEMTDRQLELIANLCDSTVDWDTIHQSLKLGEYQWPVDRKLNVDKRGIGRFLPPKVEFDIDQWLNDVDEKK